MKKQLFAILTLMLGFSGLLTAQTTHIVDNNTNGIGDFDNLPAAITAASAGDVILLVPSSTSYGNINLSTANGKQLTIAGGGANGVAGQYSIVDFIQLNGGNSGTTVLDGMIIGGVRSKGISINFVDDLELKGIHVEGDGTSESISSNSSSITMQNGQIQIENSTNVELEFSYMNNLIIDNCSNVSMYHIMAEEETSNIAKMVDIQNTSNWIISNSLFRDNTVGEFFSVDAASTGLLNNSIIYNPSSGTSPKTVALNQTGLNNNVFHMYALSTSNRLSNFIGGKYYQSNVFYDTNTSTNGITGDWPVTEYGTADANGNINYISSVSLFVDIENYVLISNSALEDAGVGNDANQSQADIGIYGGLDPMPSDLPNQAVGISVVPTVTDLRISLPSAISGGQVIINVQGSSKRN